MVATSLQDLVNDPFAVKSYFIYLSPIDPKTNREVNLYYSDNGYTSTPTESPSNTYFDPRVLAPLNFTRSMFNGGKMGGISTPSYGAISLLNSDGELDELLEYVWDNKLCVVKVGESGGNLSNYFTIFNGFTKAIEYTEEVINIILSDQQSMFAVSFPDTILKGTGGIEGDPEIKNLQIPFAMGDIINATPLLVDGDKGDYRMCFPGKPKVVDVKNQGVSLPKRQFSVDIENGVINVEPRILNNAIITLETKNDNLDTVRKMLAYLLEEYFKIDFNTIEDYIFEPERTISTVLYNNISMKDMLDNLADSFLAFYGFNRAGNFVFNSIKDPSEDNPRIRFDDTNILSLTRLPVEAPTHTVRVLHSYNHRKMNFDELKVKRLNSQELTRYKNQWFAVEAVNEETKKTYPYSPIVVIKSLFNTENSADVLAQEFLKLYGVQRNMYEIRGKTEPYTLDLNDVVQIVYPRYGLQRGKNFRIVSMTETAATNEISLIAWG